MAHPFCRSPQPNFKDRGYSVTSQKDQIQALIADIDAVLQRTTARLPWVMSGEVTQQRQMLERVRNYLVALQRRLAVQEIPSQTGARSDLLAHDIHYQQPTHIPRSADFQESNAQPVDAQQMLETVMQEMGYLRANLIQPLQTDVESLHQQRESLRQEIQQLEAQRQGYGLHQHQATQQQIIAEFLQVLMARLQETLSQQVLQTLKTLSNQSLPQGENALLSGSGSAIVPVPNSSQQPLGQPRPFQSDSDQLVVNLDATLKLVFESLERNVQAYQESLAQGLERMHSLGQQGELMVAAIVEQLAQQLKQKTSAHLQSAAVPDLKPEPEINKSEVNQDSDLSVTAPTSPEPPGPPTVETLSDLKLPYPGAELPPLVTSVKDTAELNPVSVDAAIDAWLRSADTGDVGNFESLKLENLDMPDLSLTDLELSQVEAEDIDALLNLNPDAEIGTSSSPDLSPTAPSQISSEQPSASANPFPSLEEEDTADIDAALKLLEQLSLDLPDESINTSVEDTDAEIDRMLNSAHPTTVDGEPGQITGDGQDELDELDEFYELFGADAIPDDLVDDTEQNNVWPQMSAVDMHEPSLRGSSLPEVTDLAVADAVADAVELPPQAAVETEHAIASDPTLGWDVLEHHHPAHSESSVFSVEDEISSLTDLFAEAPPSDEVSSEVAEFNLTPVEPATGFPPATDAATQELFDQALGWSMLQPQPRSPGSEQDDISFIPSEDAFIPASPEEDLLPGEEPFDKAHSGLWLDEDTLSHLNEDLSSLEQGTERQGHSLDEDPILEPEATLADWGTDAPHLPISVEQPSAISEELTVEELASFLSEPTSAQILSPTASSIPPQTKHRSPQLQEEPAFSLEGIDDLFADVPPVVPSVNPVPPPEQSAFTLEGISGLFADLSPAPSVNSVPPPIDAEVEVVPEEASSGTTSAHTPASPTNSTVETAAFTLEGMDDLFADIPSTKTPSIGNSQPYPGNPPVPFTLEGMGDLFSEAPSTIAPTPSVESAPVPPPQPDVSHSDAFTLEDASGLFADAPPVDSANSFEIPKNPVEDSLSNPTAPSETASVPEPPVQKSLEDLTLKQAIENLMGLLDTPPPTSDSPNSESPAASVESPGLDAESVEKKKRINREPPKGFGRRDNP